MFTTRQNLQLQPLLPGLFYSEKNCLRSEQLLAELQAARQKLQEYADQLEEPTIAQGWLLFDPPIELMPIGRWTSKTHISLSA